MLLTKLIAHQWKQQRRSPIWQKNLAVNLIIGFFFLLLFLEAVVISVILAFDWADAFNTPDPIAHFHGVLVWYFIGLFVFRFFIQKLPSVEIRPYQHLPIQKKTLINYLLFRGSISLFNLLTLVFLLPFALFQILPVHDAVTTTFWLVGFLGLDMAFNYIIIYLKKNLATNFKMVAITVAGVALLATIEYLQWFQFSSVISRSFTYFLTAPFSYLFFPLLAVLAYRLNFAYFKKGMYLEAFQSNSKDDTTVGNLQYLNKIGRMGQLIGLDIKLQLRNKRTRSMVMISPLFLLYGLIFYASDDYATDSGWMIFAGMFITGSVAINYLQYAFAYEGAFNDYLQSSAIKMGEIVRAKMALGTALIVASYLLTIPYIYFGIEILLINTACMLFNVGFLVPVLLFFATYNKKTMVLTKGSSFNYQGVGATHFLVMIPIFLFPIMLYLSFKWLGHPNGGLLAIGFIGLISIALRKWIIQMIVDNLKEKKYIMADGFRQRY
jgi:hypothetical protein